MKRACSQRGQIFGLTVVIMVGMLAFGAFVIDVGRLFYAHRSIQASADAAALAGAQKLPNGSAAITQANQYSGKSGSKNARTNVAGVTTAATATCRAGGLACAPVNAVEVEETTTVDANFAKVLGFGSWTIKARAVAQLVSDPMPWAIYSAASDCSSQGLLINGSNVNVDGAVTANGRFKTNGSNQSYDFASYGGPNGCNQETNGANITYGGKSTPTFEDWLKPWPVWFTEGDFACTYTAPSFNFATNGMTIPTGTYCTSGKFEINGDNMSGTITVVSPEIVVNGNNQSNFTAHQNDVLFFNTSNKELVLNGNNFEWAGIIFSPYGRVKINTYNTSVLTGMIAGLEVEINGGDFSINGAGPKGAKRKVKLVE